MENELKTLRYWFDVEALSAPDAEDADDRSEDHYVTYIRNDEYPWTMRHRHPIERHTHFVRFGVLKKTDYEQELLDFLKTKRQEDFDSSNVKTGKTFTYLGVLQVGINGEAIIDELNLAAFATSFASMRLSKNLSFENYVEVLTEFYNSLARSYESAGKAVDKIFLKKITDKALDFLSWSPNVQTQSDLTEIIVSKVCKTKEGDDREPTIEPVNGFFLSDIQRVIRDVSDVQPSGLALCYLRGLRGESRIDCSKIDTINETLKLDNLSDGRWPSEHALTLMQQVAVSEGMKRLKHGGIFSVNGPPGTGKTTLLMDIVAGVITERAKILASFSNPEQAFQHEWDVKYPRTTNAAKVYKLDERLHDFSIVVASANNGAVENVTKEFPNSGKVAERYRSQIDFFKSTATALLNTSDEDDNLDKPKEAEAWGLISAVLGKSSNRSSFTKIITGGDKDAPADATYHLLYPGESNLANWNRCKIEFQDALDRVNSIKKRLDDHEKNQSFLDAVFEHLDNLRASVSRLDIEVEDANNALAALRSRTSSKESDRDSVDRSIELSTPGFVTKILACLPSSFPLVEEAKIKVRRFEELVQQRIIMDRELSDLKEKAETIEDNNELQKSDKRALLLQITALQDRKHLVISEIAKVEMEFKNVLTFGQFQNMSSSTREQMLPRTCDELNDARALVFIKALALHRSFIVNAKKGFSANLRRALGMLSNDRFLQNIAPQAGRHLWATLSLLVPVVSSTFASFSRCFEYMPAGGIGWLIVDEAGQAVPQHAVGALFRAKRALIVGDPLQVEPVISLDKNVDLELIRRHGANINYQSTATSLQSIADDINGFGTNLMSNSGEDIWVGSPLKVHRRCVEPMFSISNNIAYDNSMVLGNGKISEEKNKSSHRPLLGESSWFDLTDKAGAKKHYFPEQGVFAMEILKAFFDQRWFGDDNKLPDLFIVAPFKSIANEMKSEVKKSLRLWKLGLSEKQIDKWIKKSIGTVHTFQGKEAETVIFMLGGNSKGAIQWAAGTPNIINVGVTRAKRRLYIIGNWAEWMENPLAKKSMGDIKWRVSKNEGAMKIRKYHNSLPAFNNQSLPKTILFNSRPPLLVSKLRQLDS